jgi:hypothetical protein
MSICYKCDLCGSITGNEINAMRINKRIISDTGGIEYSGWTPFSEIQVCDNCAFKMFDAATDGKFSSGELMFEN